jgi:hydroxymethylglutaryl-CoA lyase
MVKIIECPRDAMQGLHEFIPTQRKIAYINQLLKVGFDTIDFGSFVSPKAIPQMRDTAQVLEGLHLDDIETKLLAIVANERGAVEASFHEAIQFLGYPFSVSETFQVRNTNATIAESLERVKSIQDICIKSDKQLVVYISMGFGNPYGDKWSAEIVGQWVEVLAAEGVGILSLSDTVGVATPRSIEYLFSHLIPEYPHIEFGAHLHTQAHNWKDKIEAAHEAGCRRFDAAMRGYGGCPMAKDDLTGNMATENLVFYFDHIEEELQVDRQAFNKAMVMAMDIFPNQE